MRKTGRVLIFAVFAVSLGGIAFAQTSPTTPATTPTPTPTAAPIPVGQPNASAIGVDTAVQALKEVMVSRFEDPGLWQVSMPLDEGLIEERGIPGGPPGVQPLPGQAQAGIVIPDTTVLGVKVTFFRRGFDQFSIVPIRPLPVEGVVKTLSVWVVGRNQNHVLDVVVRGMDGSVAELPMGKLNFIGWKQLTVPIPPSVVQTDYHYSSRSGIEVLGFVVKADPLEAYGTYYVYFDDLTAVTDLFSQQTSSPNNPSDGW
jgi:hypothetical protein